MLEGLIEGLEGRFEVWRADLGLRGQIWSLEGRFVAWRAKLRPWWPTRGDGRKDGWKDGLLEIPPWVLQDISPLEPLPKKIETHWQNDSLEVSRPLTPKRSCWTNDNCCERYKIFSSVHGKSFKYMSCFVCMTNSIKLPNFAIFQK